MPENSSPGNRMTQADADLLACLRYHWGKAYEIKASDKGRTATRRDDESIVNSYRNTLAVARAVRPEPPG
jgi:hypothetical protein